MNRTTLISTLLVVPILLRAGVTPAHLLLPLVEVEQQAMNTTFQYALEYNKINEAANWMNPDTARTGIVIPERTFVKREGRPCRKFTTSITLDDRQQHGYGIACRQVNGTWYIVTDGPPAKMSVIAGRPLHVYPPPERYYVPPNIYYNPYPINFSFDYLFHDGKLHINSYHPSGPMWYPRSLWEYKKHCFYRHFRHRHLPHHHDHLQR